MKQETFSRPFNGDVDQGWAILAICWAFIACALISTMLRVWVRSRITHNLGGDDHVAVAAMVRIRFYRIDKTLILGAQSLTCQPGLDNVVDRRWIDYGGSSQWTGKTRVLLDGCATTTIPDPGLGRLDTDIYHSRTHENLHLPISSPYSGHEASGSRDVRSHIMHYSIHRRVCLLVPRSVQTSQSILGRGRRRSVFVESSSRIRRRCARQ